MEARLEQQLIPLPVVHDTARALLLTKQVHGDLPKSLAAKLPVRGIEGQLGRQAEHLIHPSQQPRGFLDITIDLVNQPVETLRLLPESRESSCNDGTLPSDRTLHMVWKGDESHDNHSTNRAGCSPSAATNTPVPTSSGARRGLRVAAGYGQSRVLRRSRHLTPE